MLTFKELELGDKFIAVPDPDDTRKNGPKGYHDIFVKIQPCYLSKPRVPFEKEECHACQIRFGILVPCSPDEKVIRIF